MTRSSNAAAPQALLAAIVESSDDAIIGKDLAGTITSWNPSAEHMYGYRAEEVIGRSIHVLVPKERRGEIDAILAKLARGEKIKQFETERVRKDGSRITVTVAISPIGNAAGKVVGASTVAREITDRKLTETTRIRQFWRAFLDVAPAAVAIFDRDMRYLEVSKRWISDYRLGGRDIIGNSHYEVFPDIPERWREIHRRCLAGATERSDADSFLRADGQVDWLSWDIRPWRGSNGEIGGIIIFTEDISERKRAEIALDRLNRTLRTLSSGNEALVRADNEQDLLDRMCRALVEVGGHRLAWIGMAEHDEGKVVRPVAWAGTGEAYLKTTKITWADDEWGRGPTGTAIRSGAPQINHDLANNPGTAPGRSAALKLGFASSVALPLRDASSGLVGALTIYSVEPNAFNDAEVKLLVELSHDLAYGVAALRTRVAHERAEALLRDAVESISEGFVIYDDEDRLVMCNERYRTINAEVAEFAIPGARFEDMLRAGLQKDVYPKPAEGEEAWLVERLRHHRNPSGAIEQSLADGRTYLITERPMNSGGIAGLRVDITDLKRAEVARQESEQRFRDIAEVASDWIWETDEQHRFKFIAGASAKRAAYELQEAMGKTRWQLLGVDPAEDDQWRQHNADLGAHRAFRDFRYSTVDKSGQPLHFAISGKPFYDTSGEFRGYRGTTTDITPIIEALHRAEEAEALLRDAVDSISEGFVIYNDQDRLVMCNEAFRTMHVKVAEYAAPGVGYEDMLRAGLQGDVYQKPAEGEEAWLAERLRRHRNPSGAIEQSLADGRTFLITEQRMRRGGIAGLRIDITALKRAEAARQESEAQLRSITANMPGAIFRRLLKPNGAIAYAFVSDGLRGIYGIEPAELTSGTVNLRDFMPAEDRSTYEEAMARSAAELSSLVVEFRVNTPKFGMRWVRSVSQPRRLDDGTIAWDGVALDITDFKKLEAARDFLAYYDQLTGLPNRALAIDRLRQALEQAQRFNASAVVVALELSSLKDIRDSSGMNVGDAAIREIAQRLGTALAGGDTIAHIGDGEFLVVLTGISKTGDIALALREITRRCEAPLTLERQEFAPKISMGISVGPEDGTEAEILIRNATTALNRAKSMPRQSVQFYSAQMTESAVRRLSIEGELRRAIEKEELVLFYQPQVNTRTFKIVGCEALIRWRHPVRGLIPPGEFIPVAEATGLIVPLGEFALRSACAQMREWQRMGLTGVPVSVNLSGWQLLQEDLGDRILAILRESGLKPESLKLELTESTILHNADAATRTMEQLHEAGVRFSVDDFGIEHSALSHLSRLPIEALKVDYSFVSQMTKDSAHAALVQAIVSMTHAMGKLAVAEGVETLIQLTYLQAYQCDALQGFLFSRAVPPEAFLPLLQRGVIEPSEARV